MSPELTLPTHKLFYLDPQPASHRPVLLLHGLGTNSSSWALQIPPLVEAGFRVIAPDTRAFGNSGFPGRTSVREMVTDFIQLLDSLEVTRTDVVGISMGGAQALQLALDHPNRVNRMVLVNTFASLRPKSLRVWGYFLYRVILVHTLGLETQANFVAQRLFPEADQEVLRREMIRQVLQASPAGYRATMRTLGLFDVTARLGEIRTPTLVITGDRDSTVPPDVQAVLARRIPGARQAVITGAGHAVSVEKSGPFNELLMDFLSDRAT